METKENALYDTHDPSLNDLHSCYREILKAAKAEKKTRKSQAYFSMRQRMLNMAC